MNDGLKSSIWSDIAFFLKEIIMSLTANVSIANSLVRDSLHSESLGISKYFKAASYGTALHLTL